MAGADISSKWLIGQSPEPWVRWLLANPEAEVEALLSTDFQHVSRLSDSLVRVRDRRETFLILTELQLRPDERMPWRMRAYAALAEERYRLPVYPVVFNLLPPPSGQFIPERFHSKFRGLVAQQDFRVIRAWELEAAEVLAQRNLALIPFVPLMRGAGERTIAQGAQILRSQPEGERLESILALFASFVLTTERIQNLLRWNMNVLRESPWYQEILEEGIKQGREQGREQGLEQGLEQGDLQGRQTTILTVLRARFNLDAPTEAVLRNNLARIDSGAVLQDLATATVQVESLADFEALLDSRLPPQTS